MPVEEAAGALDGYFAALPEVPARLAVAVSGGGDSLALMQLLAERGGAELAALTVNHGLRPEAAAEAAAVAAQARVLGLEHAVLDWRWDGRGNLSEAAREGRYAALAGWCAAQGFSDCALGHTADDNVESFFLGLMRGAGLDGLCGMRPRFSRGGVIFHRPLLAVSREALRAVLRARGVAWAEDPTNENPAYDRARIRAALGQMGLDPAMIARSVGHLAAARRDIGQELVERISGHWWCDGPDLCFDLAFFADLTPEFRRRALQAGLRFIAPLAGPHPPRAAALMPLALRDWQAEPGPATLAGVSIGAEALVLRLTRELAAAEGPVPAGAVWDGRWRFTPGSGETRALGEEGLMQIATRTSALPRRSLLASPSLWRGGEVVFAPYAGPVRGRSGGSDWAPRDDSLRFGALLRGDNPPALPPGWPLLQD